METQTPVAAQALAAAAERTRGLPRSGSTPGALRRWQDAVAVEIWSRLARMTQRCLRPLVDPELLFEINRDTEGADDSPLYGDEGAEGAAPQWQ